MGYNLLVYVK